MSKETFKIFAKNNPSLVDTVLSGKATWQQLYELYEIYGENNSIWTNLITTTSSNNNSVVDNITNSATTIKNFISTFKNIDMDSVQKGITNIQKTIGLLQDIGIGSKERSNNFYEAKPLYQKFDD